MLHSVGRPLCLLALLLALGCAKTSSHGSDGGYPSASLAGQDCDPLVPAQCGFPFPSNVYLVDDPKTPTGKHVAFGATTLPAIAGAPVDPSPWSDSDGFSPGQAPLTYLAGATATGLPTPETIAASLQPGCPTVLLDTSTDPPSLVPHFAELDVNASMGPDDHAFMIRPVVRLKDATRYIVAIRNVVDASGHVVPPTPVFQALRDGTPSSDPTVAARRALYADIFARLKAAGVDQSDLQIAWDYTTASRDNNTRQLLSMRDQALAAVGSAGPTYTITQHIDDPDPYTARRIFGTVHVPLFLDHDKVTVDQGPMVDITTGYTMTRDANGRPVMNGYGDFEFVVNIPKSLATDPHPGPVLMQGHGLFSNRSEAQDGNSHDNNLLVRVANQDKYVTVALDLIGWREPGTPDGWPADTNQEDDSRKAAAMVNQDVGVFRRMIDRGTQGILNELVAMRMMKTSFAQDPLVQFNGHSVIDTTQLYYEGSSQGGILGATYMALTQDVTRGYLGNAGMPYNLLLMRSTDFGQFLVLMQANYGSGRNVQLVLGLMQMFWDRLEGDGFAPYISANPLEKTPLHNVLMDVSIGDFQVTPLGAHILGRAVGARNLAPAVREIWGLPDAASPYQGNGLLEFDFGVENRPDVTIPSGDIAPAGPDDVDPHSALAGVAAVPVQIDTFLRTGQATNPCGGVCKEMEQ